VVRRILSLTAVIVTSLLLQSTVFAQVKLLGVRPELMYIVTILMAIIEGPSEGAIVGFAGGMAQDFLLDQPKGITALTLTLLGYAIGLARQYIVSPSPLLPMILVAVGTFAGVIFYEVVSFLLGQLNDPLLFSLRVAFLTAVYNAVLTPLVYPVLRRIFEGSRPKRVVRF
jgi:rod shape-determining protein MreD